MINDIMLLNWKIRRTKQVGGTYSIIWAERVAYDP